MSRYRAEVDGLRAVAVLPVILFHAGVQTLSGGFLGVDVFFVISGYLISRIILDELEAGHFSLLSFYERRARRILPALFVVMAFTFPLAYILAPPAAFSEYLGSLRATALFYSNVHFWQNLGYFNPSAEQQPLLHTWSLGVEEQFYILFPWLLWLVWRFAQKYLLLVFVGLSVIAFGVCLIQANRNHDAAFFLLHARAWELFAGVIATLLERKFNVAALRSKLAAKWLAAFGVILIAAGFLVVRSGNDVPGWLTMFPVAGTFLVLLFAGNGGVAGRVLSAKPLVALGLVSYGAYLWHHPLLAFARLYSINTPDLLVMLGLAVLAVVLATLTYFTVEKPFRNRTLMSKRSVFALSAIAIVSIVFVSVWGGLRHWSVTRFDPSVMALIDPPLYKAADCPAWTKPDGDVPEIKFCSLGAKDVSHPVVVWGDSHVRALLGEIDSAMKLKGRSVVYVDGTDCLRLPGTYEFGGHIQQMADTCVIKQKRAFRAVADLQPAAFILGMRWITRLYPLPGAGPSVGFDNGEGGVEVKDDRDIAALGGDGVWSVGLEGKSKAVTDFFATLTKIAPLIVVGPVPEVGWHVGDTNFKTMVLRHEAPSDISTATVVFQKRNEAVLQILDAASKSQTISRVEPSKLFCDTMKPGRCVAQQDGIAYYSDDDHLSQTGARLLVEQIVKALPQP